MENLQNKILNFDLKALIISKIKKADRPFWLSFFITLIALNIIFLYHGTNFMFGDHDWKYLKNDIPLNSGLFEARFSQFLLINGLSYGKILPIINNFLGFCGFCLGISLLAKYWEIPHTPKSYITFSLFTSLTPYILSFMYFAFLVIPCLSWNAFIIGGLLISTKEQKFSILKTLTASTIFMLALGGYPPVINLYATALCTKLFLDSYLKKLPLKELLLTHRYSVINFLLGAFFYKLCIIYFTKTGAINPNYYNLQTIPFNQYLDKFILISKDLFKQFTVTLPFIEAPYKLTTLIIILLAITSLIVKSSKNHPNKLISTIFFIGIFYSALITLFLSTSIKETEFSPRIDFFGLLYVYSAMLCIIMHLKLKFAQNLAFICCLFSIFINTNTLLNAQKVWKLGFETELNLHKRVNKRYENSPLFNQYGKYIIVQGGSPSFRHKYYTTPYSHTSDDLLDISYVPAMNSGVMLNYYTSPEYADTTAYVYTFRPDAQAIEYLKTASPWPSINSTYIGGYYIIKILDQQGLNYLRSQYLR